MESRCMHLGPPEKDAWHDLVLQEQHCRSALAWGRVEGGKGAGGGREMDYKAVSDETPL